MHTKDKFIAFIDILGFSAMVEAAEQDGNCSRLIELIETLKTVDQLQKERGIGLILCPQSRSIAFDLDFQLTQISDCVVISAEVSPAGIMALINHCFTIALAFVLKGALCRGFITRGNIYHRDGQCIGTGYMRAYRNESKVCFMRGDELEV